MRAKMIAALASLVAICGATNAHAAWEKTRWGMSPKEVLSVVPNAKPYKPRANEIYTDHGADYAPLVKANYGLGGIETSVSLLFDKQKRLAFALINPVAASDCKDLKQHVVSTHGAGKTTAVGGTIEITDWSDGNDQIKLTASSSAGICNLSWRSK
ncbi:hypothetical protein AAIB41_07420 [Brucella sp. BE17]|uniref:hypothetical protein n=1 Tax=Brucella sp. BE17 TaxID=3142977 RepID=UPI0031BA89AC